MAVELEPLLHLFLLSNAGLKDLKLNIPRSLVNHDVLDIAWDNFAQIFDSELIVNVNSLLELGDHRVLPCELVLWITVDMVVLVHHLVEFSVVSVDIANLRFD